MGRSSHINLRKVFWVPTMRNWFFSVKVVVLWISGHKE